MEDYAKTHALTTFGTGYYINRGRMDEFRKELEQMVLVADEEQGGGYEWDVFYVYWHTGRKRYYYITGSGCSCDWISEGVDSLGDFQDAALQSDIIKAFKREKIEDGYGWNESDLARFTTEVKKFRE